ncbi:UDP-glucose:undecaprenyl-phosphate glucose-1-phosphate transferase [Rubripirellula obstinata]|uniref:UDP-glucose:undecaprenyl-phosphate glucose-1-phosphate transferase n=1 Tax=Rubripirellula obstinata TaxID=406547 RepID=A0A5B1CFR1_9BACT|nr:undecaprenyl-phosphate galactose phosphotransferase WbaP [Rubripirellula obstinata]KAA1259032.1 UDP-glucose:undecaprenyl-phosphate glucose-1-phosphate transferase [Rubripirellula obstinata]
MPELPIGVISADVIEHAEPFYTAEMEVDALDIALPEQELNKQRRRTSRPTPLGTGPREAVRFVLTAGSLMICDLLTITTCFAFSASVSQFLLGSKSSWAVVPHLGAILLCYVVIGGLMKLFPATAMSPVLELRQLVYSCLMAVGLVLLLNQLFAVLSPAEIVIGLTGGISSAFMLPLTRVLSRHFLSACDWWGERAVILGAGAQGRAIFTFYDRAPQRGLRPVGLVSLQGQGSAELKPSQFSDFPYLGSADRLSLLTRMYRIRWGIVAPDSNGAMSMNQIMKFGTELKHLLVLPSKYLVPSLWSSSRECAGVLGVHVSDQLRRPLARAMKRAIDIVSATTALVLLAPVIGITILLIKLRSPGPAFFGHERIGRDGKTFKAWKLRTMVPNASEVLEEHLENDPEMRMEWMEDQKLKNDPRIIPGIGTFLRSTSLDELPQLFNVFLGEMSMVGPRPIVTSEIERYGDMYSMYLRVVPGITGLWQVSGRNNTSYAARVRLDSYYVCNWSVWLDAYICVRTIRTMLLREGAY